MPSARKKRERRRRREGAGPPIRRPAGVCRGCQRAVAEEAVQAILRPNHPCEPCLASPSLYSSMYHHPLLPAHTTQHIRSRHAIAQLSTCPRPYRFASSTRWVLPFNIYHAIMPSCGDASSSASHSTFQRPAVSNKPPQANPLSLLSLALRGRARGSIISSRLVSRLISSQLCASD